MDDIEFEAPVESRCDCCGGEQIVLTRYVSRDDNAFAIYKGVLTTGHGTPRADMVVGFGHWSETESPKDRVAFAFQLWSGPAAVNVTIVGPDQTAWRSGFIGVLLAREEALRHPMVEEVYALADHILECDHPVINHLSGGT